MVPKGLFKTPKRFFYGLHGETLGLTAHSKYALIPRSPEPYTYTHTHTPSDLHTCTHAHMHTHAHTHTHTHQVIDTHERVTYGS